MLDCRCHVSVIGSNVRIVFSPSRRPIVPPSRPPCRHRGTTAPAQKMFAGSFSPSAMRGGNTAPCRLGDGIEQIRATLGGAGEVEDLAGAEHHRVDGDSGNGELRRPPADGGGVGARGCCEGRRSDVTAAGRCQRRAPSALEPDSVSVARARIAACSAACAAPSVRVSIWRSLSSAGDSAAVRAAVREMRSPASVSSAEADRTAIAPPVRAIATNPACHQ